MSEEYIGWLDDEWNTVLDQSQPIVRCRDCANLNIVGKCPCGFWALENLNGYCAWAKRKEGGDEWEVRDA